MQPNATATIILNNAKMLIWLLLVVDCFWQNFKLKKRKYLVHYFDTLKCEKLRTRV